MQVRKELNLEIEIHKTKYREFFNFVDQFMALRFMVTGALLAARCIQNFLMNQHACWLIAI
jgi:hypothetical protein